MFNLFSSPVNDVDRGRDAVIDFHNQNSRYSNYTMSLDELLMRVGGKNPEFFLEGLGLAIVNIDMRDSQVGEAMHRLADLKRGAVPEKQEFFKALSDRAQDINFSDVVYASPDIGLGIAKDIGKGAAQIGDAVLDTGKTLLVIGPILIVAAIVFVGDSYTRRVAGR